VIRHLEGALERDCDPVLVRAVANVRDGGICAHRRLADTPGAGCPVLLIQGGIQVEPAITLYSTADGTGGYAKVVPADLQGATLEALLCLHSKLGSHANDKQLEMDVAIIGILRLNQHISMYRLEIVLTRSIGNWLVMRLKRRGPGRRLGDEVCMDLCSNGALVGDLVLPPRIELTGDLGELSGIGTYLLGLRRFSLGAPPADPLTGLIAPAPSSVGPCHGIVGIRNRNNV